MICKYSNTNDYRRMIPPDLGHALKEVADLNIYLKKKILV